MAARSRRRCRSRLVICRNVVVVAWRSTCSRYRNQTSDDDKQPISRTAVAVCCCGPSPSPGHCHSSFLLRSEREAKKECHCATHSRGCQLSLKFLWVTFKKVYGLGEREAFNKKERQKGNYDDGRMRLPRKAAACCWSRCQSHSLYLCCQKMKRQLKRE